MPVIAITMGKGQADTTQKQALIERFTTAACEITKIPAQSFTILINELEADSIGVGGKTLIEILADRKALQS